VDKSALFIDSFLSMSHGFAYDESDELALPQGRQSAGWLRRASGTELAAPEWVAKRFVGHYYWWWSD
jgi:hypothetical protein